MQEKKEIHPPRWAERLLRWYCKPSLLEDLQGDLNEYFERNLKTKGVRKARWIYILDVLKFFRPYTLRTPEFVNLFIQWIMIRSYIKTSGRSIVRNKLFSVINIFGLAISMSVGLLMIALLTDIFSYDKFHVKKDQIYRVNSRYDYMENGNFRTDNQLFATTSWKVGKTIKESFTGVEGVTIIRERYTADLKYGEKVLPLKGLWTDESFLSVFTFPLLQGKAATALKEPYSIVLTEQSAKKLFGDGEAMGKTLVLNGDKEYVVTGILKDIPQLSHIKFDVLTSLSTRELSKDDEAMKWDNIWSTWVYVVIPEKSQADVMLTNMHRLAEKEDQTVKNTHIELFLEPMDQIMLDDLSNEIGQTLGRSLLWTFAGLAFVVMLSACFNYTNLSIARSFRRSREVGIRKVIGALRSNVIAQFVVEAVLISLAALVLAFLMFLLLKPYFINLEKDLQQILVLDLTPKLILIFIGFAVLIGILAGFFPALFFSKINAIQVLKNVSNFRVFRRLTMRKVLITFQYTVSIALITSTLIIFKQYKYFLNFDLGFTTENILNIALQGNKAELLKKELAELPEVKGISQSIIVTSVGNYWGAQMKYMPANPQDSAGVYYNTVDEYYMPLHDHKLIAGRNFIHKPDSAVENEIIVNEYVLKRFDIANQDPQKAIGEVVKLDGKDMTIIGVMKNFQYGTAHDRIGTREVILRYSNTNANFLNVKILSTDWLATRDKIEAIWRKHDQVHTFNARFYDDQLEDAYSGIKASLKLAGFISFLTIAIASLGLLGMVVFTTETRLKEVSIRKVLGATEARLLFILGKGFFILLGIAAMIGLTLTVLFFEQVLFQELGNHAPISIVELASGVGIVFLIALTMILSQTLKIARSNPAQVLKTE